MKNSACIPTLTRLAFAAVIALTFALAAAAQEPAVSNTTKFGTVSKTDAAYTAALDAHNKDDAANMVGRSGSFRGTVSKVFMPGKGSIVILNFDEDYKTALTAVIKKADISKFPDLEKLVGHEIVVSGKFIDYKGNAEIELTDPKQILLVTK